MKISRNKKSSIISPEALVRIIGAVLVFLLIIFPACDKLYDYLKGQEYLKSFENFADGINKMGLGRETFTIRLKETSALIGFSKNSERYECFNCILGTENMATRVVEKPRNDACNGNACICLCIEGFKLVPKAVEGKQIVYGECRANLVCKSTEKDIINNLPFKIHLAGARGYWNGFLFVNGVDNTNGLQPVKHELNTLIAEKRFNTVAVCNQEILDFNKRIGLDKCMVTEYDEAKRLEKTNMQEALKKYEEFVKKYKIGKEVEESLFIIGKSYFDQAKHKESTDALCLLNKDFPATSYKNDIFQFLNTIHQNSLGTDNCK